MTKASLALLALAFLAIPASAATDDELRAQIVGSWGEDAACTSGNLTFKADGSFTTLRTSEGADSERAGTYTIEGGILTGSSPEGSMPEVNIRIEGDKLFLERDGQVVDDLTRCA